MAPQQRYVVQRVLRESLFGKVSLSLDLKTRQYVAVKQSNVPSVQTGTTLQGGHVLEDPLNEARVMEHLPHHPHVLPLVEDYFSEESHFLVMPFMPHGEFFDLLAKLGHMEDATARFYFKQMVSALHHIHKHNIAHLDFSLENLLVDSQYNIRLCDFGVARHIAPDDGLISFGSKKPGKLRYLAPEVLVDQPADPFAIDMFALGVTLFSMLTGVAPFEYALEQDRRFHMIAKGQLKQLLKAVGKDHLVSSEAADLLQGLLNPHQHRLTLNQLLNHPWLKKPTMSS